MNHPFSFSHRPQCGHPAEAEARSSRGHHGRHGPHHGGDRGFHPRHGDESTRMRQHAHRGGGPFGEGGVEGFRGRARQGGGPRGGGRPGGGRMLGHGDLKLLLLALIEQQPRHGYELIRTIAEMFNGHYTPSPGSIYPTLTLLEDMQLVGSEPGARKRYSVTDAGRQFLQENREVVDAVLARTRHSARESARMNLPPQLHEATHKLRHALLSPKTGWSEAETARVIDILERAASDIAKGREAGEG